MKKAAIASSIILLTVLLASSEPSPVRASGGITYLPLVFINFDGVSQPTRYGVACSDDPWRGQLYRDLVNYTNQILYYPEMWSAGMCCGADNAQHDGEIVGSIAGLSLAIFRKIIALIWEMFLYIIGTLGSLINLIGVGASSYGSISCTEDAQGFCVGLAAIIALDDMAGGIFTLFAIFITAILTFYFGMYLVKEVREIFQPSGGDE